MSVRGRIRVRVICVKSFLREMIALNVWLKMPKNPTSFICSSGVFMAVSLIILNPEVEDEVWWGR
ncbi:hypothetical protein HanXRQr2_Chr05g0235231 [Helianthus annuus]|uniref:Uncharacterized protein n=1 Tax=Helianthus annuus TaxID=4232 RepID=A0A9K3NNT9_HELAN|nr:hypothetical protein HanXRQr2_Chr05g0235231 [Helianthus annuus]